MDVRHISYKGDSIKGSIRFVFRQIHCNVQTLGPPEAQENGAPGEYLESAIQKETNASSVCPVS